MNVDKVTISIKSGKGGDGSVSFLRAKCLPNGGPNGGDGGNGGNIIFRATTSKNTLIDFTFVKKFEAQDGENGSSNNCYGKNGEDVIIDVPCGTIIKSAETGKILADMFADGDTYVALKGGRGGKGNAFFKSSTRQAPHFSQLGENFKAYKVILELKTIADVALVGKPNVGKSTLLSIISNAKPKIANYEFTTLSPNLGVVKYYDKSFVVADIPGLIEGASLGAGLGHDFLGHIERTRLIVHVIDGSSYYGNVPEDDYDIIVKELEAYQPNLINLPKIVVLTKMDLLEDGTQVVKNMQKHVGKDVKVIAISSITRQNVDILIKEIYEILKDIPALQPIVAEQDELLINDITSLNIQRLDEHTYEVSGGYINNLQRGIVFTDPASSAYFHHRLEKDGVMQKIRDKGAKNGDTIIMGSLEYELVD